MCAQGVPQIFLGQQAPSSSTLMGYSPSLSQSGVGVSLQSGSTATTLPFSMQRYRQQLFPELFHTSPGPRGKPSLSVHTEKQSDKPCSNQSNCQ